MCRHLEKSLDFSQEAHGTKAEWSATHVGQVYLTCPGRLVRVTRGAREKWLFGGKCRFGSQVDKPVPRRGEPNLEYGAVRRFSFLRPERADARKTSNRVGRFLSLNGERRSCAGDRVGWFGRRSYRNQNGGITVL
jgi:hypothetical protein